MVADSDESAWSRYERLVLFRLEDLGRKLDALEAAHDATQRAVTALKVKAGVWGLLGGLIPVLILLALAALQHMQAASHASRRAPAEDVR